MANITYEFAERRIRMHTKTYLVLCLVLFLSLGFYTFKKWGDYNLAKLAVKNNQEFVAVLRQEVSNEKGDYDLKKKEFDDLSKAIESQLKSIFPKTDDYTGLTRQFDSFEQQLAKINNPLEISSIDYQLPIQKDGYAILPVRMTIKSSAENFTKFLHLIENSGSITNNIRIMDISSIRLNFEKSDKDEKVKAQDLINFSVQINAYFQQ